MKYLLGQMVWRNDRWEAPSLSQDKILDLRPLSSQAKQRDAEGSVLIATERDPLPGEVLLASARRDSLSPRATDAVRDLLRIPEPVYAHNVPALCNRLMGVYSDPEVGLICPPMIPNSRGNIRFTLGDISFGYGCPSEGAQWENILKVERENYRNARETGTHRKLLSVLRDKYRVDDYEVFIPRDLPRETPLQPSTTLTDNFDVGNHADINGQASSQGWLWDKFQSAASAIIRTDTQVYAECQTNAAQTVSYRAGTSLSSTDHYVQAGLRTENNALTPIILGRKDASSTLTFYECQLGAGSDVLWVTKVIAGATTVISSPALTINTATFYTIKLNINGSTLQVFNGITQVGTDDTDSAISAGLYCGIRAQGSDATLRSGGIEDFEASDGVAVSGGGPLFRSNLAASALSEGRLAS